MKTDKKKIKKTKRPRVFPFPITPYVLAITQSAKKLSTRLIFLSYIPKQAELHSAQPLSLWSEYYKSS